MSKKCEMSPLECQIALQQIARRARYRVEFLKKKGDPCMHSQEAGYVFDEHIQRFSSLKATHFESFKPAPRNIMFSTIALLPFFIYGYCIYNQRAEKEALIRAGKIKYKDRTHKLI